MSIQILKDLKKNILRKKLLRDSKKQNVKGYNYYSQNKKKYLIQCNYNINYFNKEPIQYLDC